MESGKVRNKMNSSKATADGAVGFYLFWIAFGLFWWGGGLDGERLCLPIPMNKAN